MITNQQLIDGYCQMVTERVAAGWKPYLLTFMFEQIDGSPRPVTKIMEDEIERVYATLLPRIVRNSHSPSHQWKRPVWICSPDFPVPKHDRQDMRDVFVNDGRHYHTVPLMPPVSRLKGSLDDYIREEQARYVRHPLFRIDAERITHDPGYVTDYVLKSLKRGRIGPDQVLILPRAISELRPSRKNAA